MLRCQGLRQLGIWEEMLDSLPRWFESGWQPRASAHTNSPLQRRIHPAAAPILQGQNWAR